MSLHTIMQMLVEHLQLVQLVRLKKRLKILLVQCSTSNTETGLNITYDGSMMVTLDLVIGKMQL